MSAIAGGILAGMISNVAADQKANEQFEREQQLMRMQNRMNQHNALMAYSNQVQGAKLAGLSPAMLNGATPQVAAPVSKGTAQMAENVEFDQTLGMLDAQKRNVEAQTEKTKAETAKIEGVDTENVKSDTALKTAQKIHTDADVSRVKQEAERIKNINTVWNDENDAMSTFGQAMAQKWTESKWFNSLAPDTKATIRSMADGEIVLTIGGVNALERAIFAQKNLSDADRALVKNAFDNIITDSMLQDKKVMEALTKMPEIERNKARAQIYDLIQSGNVHNIDWKWKNKEFESKQFNDPDWTWQEFWKDPSLKNFMTWIQASYSDKLNSLRETAQNAVVHYVGAKAFGEAAGQAVSQITKSGKAEGVNRTFDKTIDHPTIYGNDGSILRRGYTEHVRGYKNQGNENQGVQSMKFKK